MSKDVIKDALEWKGRMVKLLETTKDKEYVVKHIEIIDGLLLQNKRYREAIEKACEEVMKPNITRIKVYRELNEALGSEPNE